MNLQITHKTDNDGEFCRTLYEIFTEGIQSKCYRINYSEKNKVLSEICNGNEEYENIFFTDIAIREDDMNILKELFKKVSGYIYIIDHHKHTLDNVDRLKEEFGEKIKLSVRVNQGDRYVSAAYILVRVLDEMYTLPLDYNKETVYYVANLVSEMDTFMFKVDNDEYAKRLQYLYAINSIDCQKKLKRYMKEDKKYLEKELNELDMTEYFNDIERFRKAIDEESISTLYQGVKVVILEWPKLKYKDLKSLCLAALMDEEDVLPICFILEGDVYRLTSEKYNICELATKLNMRANKPKHVALTKDLFIKRNNLEIMPDSKMIHEVKKLIEK